jgi:hypothetical protein
VGARWQWFLQLGSVVGLPRRVSTGGGVSRHRRVVVAAPEGLAAVQRDGSVVRVRSAEHPAASGHNQRIGRYAAESYPPPGLRQERRHR